MIEAFKHSAHPRCLILIKILNELEKYLLIHYSRQPSSDGCEYMGIGNKSIGDIP